jgi:hypothetical protein
MKNSQVWIINHPTPNCNWSGNCVAAEARTGGSVHVLCGPCGRVPPVLRVETRRRSASGPTADRRARRAGDAPPAPPLRPGARARAAPGRGLTGRAAVASGGARRVLRSYSHRSYHVLTVWGMIRQPSTEDGSPWHDSSTFH